MVPAERSLVLAALFQTRLTWLLEISRRRCDPALRAYGDVTDEEYLARVPTGAPLLPDLSPGHRARISLAYLKTWRRKHQRETARRRAERRAKRSAAITPPPSDAVVAVVAAEAVGRHDAAFAGRSTSSGPNVGGVAHAR